MSTNPTDHTDRDAKRADQLAVGDHVIEQYDGGEKPAKVLAAQPFRNGDGTRMVSLMLDTLDGGRPLFVEYRAEWQIPLATEAELAGVASGARRTALVKALHRLADDIAEHRLPIPTFTVTFGGVLDSRADLAVWAKHLGSEIQMGGNGDIPVIRTDIAVVESLSLHVGLQASTLREPKPEQPAEPEPELAQEWLFTFGSGQQHDGRFVRITGTYESARSRMNLVFGHAWCAQYDWKRFDEEGLPARVTELPESEWPPHFEVITIPAADVNAFIDHVAKLAGE